MISVLDTIPFSKVCKAPLVRPAVAGHKWKGVPHKDLINGVIAALTDAKLHPAKPEAGRYLLSRMGADLTASIPVGHVIAGIQAHLGFVSSNACRRALTFYIGCMIGDTPVCVHSYGGIRQFPSWEYVESFNLKDVCEEAVEIYKQNEWRIGECLQALREVRFEADEVRKILFSTAEKGWNTFKVSGQVWNFWSKREEKDGISLLAAYGNTQWNGKRDTERFKLLLDLINLILNLEPVSV